MWWEKECTNAAVPSTPFLCGFLEWKNGTILLLLLRLAKEVVVVLVVARTLLVVSANIVAAAIMIVTNRQVVLRSFFMAFVATKSLWASMVFSSIVCSKDLLLPFI